MNQTGDAAASTPPERGAGPERGAAEERGATEGRGGAEARGGDEARSAAQERSPTAPRNAPVLAVIADHEWKGPWDPKRIWLGVLVVLAAAGIVALPWKFTQEVARAARRAGGWSAWLGSWWKIALLALVIVLLGMLCLALLRWIASSARSVLQGAEAGLDPAFRAAPRCIMKGELPKENWTAARRGKWLSDLLSRTRASAFVRAAHLVRIAAFPIIEHPVEPERIGGALVQPEMRMVLIGSGVVAIMAFEFRGWLLLVFAVAVGSAFLRLLWRRALFTPVVAGQGWVEHGRARWTVADSVLVVTGQGTPDIRLVGPQGVLRLRLSMKPEADGQFATLWTRWMHPHPKPDQRAFRE